MEIEKLTKAQKALLEQMRDGAFISNWVHSYKYRLNKKTDGDCVDRVIKPYWVHNVLAPFLRKEWISAIRTTHYYFRSDAEISDDWRALELARQEQSEADAERQRVEEIARQDKEASDYFNLNSPGAFTVEMKGQWPFSGSILFNGQAVASIWAATYSNSDKSFADILKREANIPHFNAIKLLVSSANAAWGEQAQADGGKTDTALARAEGGGDEN